MNGDSEFHHKHKRTSTITQKISTPASEKSFAFQVGVKKLIHLKFLIKEVERKNIGTFRFHLDGWILLTLEPFCCWSRIWAYRPGRQWKKWERWFKICKRWSLEVHVLCTLNKCGSKTGQYKTFAGTLHHGLYSSESLIANRNKSSDSWRGQMDSEQLDERASGTTNWKCTTPW